MNCGEKILRSLPPKLKRFFIFTVKISKRLINNENADGTSIEKIIYMTIVNYVSTYANDMKISYSSEPVLALASRFLLKNQNLNFVY